jgi:hypothetical protein
VESSHLTHKPVRTNKSLLEFTKVLDGLLCGIMEAGDLVHMSGVRPLIEHTIVVAITDIVIHWS